MLSPKEIKEEAERLLELTYDFRSEKLLRVPFRNEAYLYNQICLMLWKMDEKEKCVAEYKRLVECFINSRVNIKYHFRSLILLLLNMSDRMWRIGEGDQAAYWTEQALRVVLINGKATTIERLLSNLVSITSQKESECSLKMAKLTFWCSDLFKHDKFMDATLKYVKNQYDMEYGTELI